MNTMTVEPGKALDYAKRWRGKVVIVLSGRRVVRVMCLTRDRIRLVLYLESATDVARFSEVRGERVQYAQTKR